ncbi:MAG: hypothetical protein NVS2B14_00440 [Chamaesiphon sp.]
MSTFNNGGGTLTSTNLPRAFVECALLLAVAQIRANQLYGDSLIYNAITVDTDFANNHLNIQAGLPTIFDSAGSQTRIISPLRFGADLDAFNPGSNGDLTDTDLATAFMSVAQLLSLQEKRTLPKVAWRIKADTTQANAFTVTASLPIQLVNSSGEVAFTVIDYL